MANGTQLPPTVPQGILDNIAEFLQNHCTGNTTDTLMKAYDHSLYLEVGSSRFSLSDLDHKQSHTSPAKPGFQTYTLEELKNLQLPSPDPVIEDLVFAGETTVIAGRPKVGKSRLVHQMALAIQDGHEFLGMKVPRPRRVLVVDLENRPASLKDRLTRMANGSCAPHLRIYCADLLSTVHLDGSEAGLRLLSAYVEAYDIDVVIIDPWRLWLDGDENDAAEVVRCLKGLASIRSSRPNLTIIIVHHVRKERFDSPRKLLAEPRLWVESISGHYALVSHVDSAYGLERQVDEDGEEWIVFGGIARNTEPRTILLEDDPATLRFEVRRNEEALILVLTPAERAIWAVAKGLPKFIFTELVAAANTKNRKAVSGMLKKAEAQGLLSKAGTLYTVV